MVVFVFTGYPLASHQRHQRRMSEVLEGMNGVVCMMDDILIHGGTQEEHDEPLRAVLERLQKAGITLNHKKCLFSVSQVTFLGQVVDSSGIRPDPEKVSTILRMPATTDISGVRRFLGVVNQMSKFIPNVAERTHKRISGYGESHRRRHFRTLKSP